MEAKAQTYHDDMVTTLNVSEKETWDQEIQKADVDHVQDYKAMDIMKTRDVKRPVATESRDAIIADGRDANEEWMRLALMIEEQQQ
ncbi:hypothetical protein DXG01_015675, partial [Tephrocybe rancida]